MYILRDKLRRKGGRDLMNSVKLWKVMLMLPSMTLIASLRNIDKPELLIFTSAKLLSSVGGQRVMAEALEQETLSVFLMHAGSNPSDIHQSQVLPCRFFDLQDERPPPHPITFTKLRKSVLVHPDGFANAPAVGEARNPEAQFTVVFSDTVQCNLGARAAGMRVVGVNSDYENIEGFEESCDVVFRSIGETGVDSELVYFDDLYTPGSYWLNPSIPRDSRGVIVNPETGIPLDEVQRGEELNSERLSKSIVVRSEDDDEDEEIQRILSDIDAL
jgi:hypothetical protein